MPTHADPLRDTIAHAARVIADLERLATDIERLRDAIADTLARRNLVATCGNGGSAAHALHLAEELVGRYRAERAPKPALCLCADPTALTCIANDYGFDEIFARPADALLNPGDTLLAISTSGNSENIRRALERARARGVTTCALLGRTGGACAPLCDHAVIVPDDNTARIQEAHQLLIHLILDAVDDDP